jgi:hypothetical protein
VVGPLGAVRAGERYADGIAHQTPASGTLRGWPAHGGAYFGNQDRTGQNGFGVYWRFGAKTPAVVLLQASFFF